MVRFRTFRDVTGLNYYLATEFSNLLEKREKVLSMINKLPIDPTIEEIVEGSNCSRCRSYLNKTGPICRHCKLDDIIQQYSNCLSTFRYKTKSIKSNNNNSNNNNNKIMNSPLKGIINRSNQSISIEEDNNDSHNTHNKEMDRGEQEIDSFIIMIIKLLRNFANRYNHKNFINITNNELLYYKNLKYELNCIKNIWNRYLELLKVFDELQQCKQRIQLANNPLNKHQNDEIVMYSYELNDKYMESFQQTIIADNDLKEAIGTLNFYKNQEYDYRIANEKRNERNNRLMNEFNRNNSNKTNELNEINEMNESNENANELNDFENSNNDNTQCVICREEYEIENGMIVLLPCAHIFHKDCIHLWLKTHKKCVICKRSVQMKDITTINHFNSNNNNHTNSIIKSPNLKINNDNENIIITNNINMNSNTKVIEISSKFDRKINGQYGTKIDQLIRDLLDFIESNEHQSEKAIVFSQWIEMIDIVSQALINNHILYKCCIHSKDFKQFGSLDQFKSNPDISVLLMSLHLGAEGLDLIVASHIFLLEPLVNTNIELQAINRIDRIGQTKATFICKYIIKNTIEEKIYQTNNIESQKHDSSDIIENNRDNEKTDSNNNINERETQLLITPQKHISPKRPRVSKGKQDQSSLSFHDIFEMLTDN